MSTRSPKTEPQQNVRFLISCIRHSNGGKVDFEAVAKELGIVTKAAAAKRYERLIKAANKDSSSAAAPSDGDETPTKPATTKRKALALSGPKASPAKKAKAAPRGKKGKVKMEEKEDGEEETKAESDSSLSGTTSQDRIKGYISLANSENIDAPEDLEEPVKAEED
ncbi:hypothetical protein G3M48_002598 [Beauveria asiatica]|uniref:Myb-like DNA-binding domain-containing protein n=1 Tax=Beauveria asiatica TaxID=1069075 RepID=A0AAW0RWW6_9HYPO